MFTLLVFEKDLQQMHLYIYIDAGWKIQGESFPEMLLQAS